MSQLRNQQDLLWALCWKCGANFGDSRGVILGYLNCGHIICRKCIVVIPQAPQAPGSRGGASGTSAAPEFRCPECSKVCPRYSDICRTEFPSHIEAFFGDPVETMERAFVTNHRVHLFRERYYQQKVRLLERRLANMKQYVENVTAQSKAVKERHAALTEHANKLNESRKKAVAAYMAERQGRQGLLEKLSKLEASQSSTSRTRDSEPRQAQSQRPTVAPSPGPSVLGTPQSMTTFRPGSGIPPTPVRPSPLSRASDQARTPKTSQNWVEPLADSPAPKIPRRC